MCFGLAAGDLPSPVDSTSIPPVQKPVNIRLSLPPHYIPKALQELEDESHRSQRQAPERSGEAGGEALEAMHAMPGLTPSQTTDGVGPVRLGRDPLPINPSLQRKQGHVNEVGQAFQIRRIAASTNEAHERCHVVDIPDSSGISEAGSPSGQSKENHRQLKLRKLVVACVKSE